MRESMVETNSVVELKALLGRKARDVNTGFEGVLSAFAFYDHGKMPMLHISGLDLNGRPVAIWLDRNQVRLLGCDNLQ